MRKHININLFTYFSPPSEAEISKLILSSHPTTCPLNPIPSHLLQAISPAVVPALTHIVNTSLHTGIFPSAKFPQPEVGSSFLLPALLCTVDVMMAPLNLSFYLLFYVFLLSLFTRITSALFIYDKRTLLDIGHRCTNLLQDTLSMDPAWPYGETPSVPDTAVMPSDNFSVLRMDRTAEAGKNRGGGVCFMINKKWCDTRNMFLLASSGTSLHCLPPNQSAPGVFINRRYCR